jgi:FkbM family methyltransferase
MRADDENDARLQGRKMNTTLKEGLRRFFPRSLVSHRILGGPLRGSEIVTSWHDYPAAILGRTELPLLKWFAQNVGIGETWLDVGAHYGYTAIALCKLVGVTGRIYAFEPMLNTAGCVFQARSLNNLPQMTVIPVALGNSGDLGMDSLLSVRGMIDSTLKETEGMREPFLVSRLDWLWPIISGLDPRIDGIKIDVQGMEIQVLEGMAAVLKQYRPKLLVELHTGVSRPRLLEVLDSCGYLPRGVAVEPLPGETDPVYADRTYFFQPAKGTVLSS